MARKKTHSGSSRARSRERDFVDVADDYAAEVVADRKGEKFGRWIRLAAKRYLADRRRAARKSRPPFYFDREIAIEHCEFIECLPHVEGEWDAATIKLHPSQVFFVVQLFGFRRIAGWRKNERGKREPVDGGRRFTTALFAVARKNAKSTLAAAILLSVLCLEEANGPQVLTAARTGDQARIVWSIAKRMVEKLPDLQEWFSIEAFANAIARYDVGGTFKPINAKASTQDGLNPSALCFDELHAHKDADLYNVLRSAAGARRNPLFLYTTTEGYENPGPWREVREFAKNVLKGGVEADHFLALYYAVDKKDGDFDERAWRKANPLLGLSIGLDKLREHATEAKQQPSALGEFRIKRLNRQSASADSWININKWKRCAGAVDLEKLKGRPCWGAFDLASTTDMASWWLVWLIEGHYYAWGRYWVPNAAVVQRTERGTASYEGWVESGLVDRTEGDVTDYAVIEKAILEDYERFQPKEIAYDPWNASDLVNRLTEEELPLVLYRQGPQSFHPAMQELERAYLSRRFSHAGHPVLQWNAANIVARKDVNNNMAPDKKKSPDKIDGMVCVIMAIGRALVTESDEIEQGFVSL